MQEGDTYGSLTAVRQVIPQQNEVWEFVCSCGNVSLATLRNVEYGRTKSCGECQNRRLQKFAGMTNKVQKELRAELFDLIDRYKLTDHELARLVGSRVTTVRMWRTSLRRGIPLRKMERLREAVKNI